MTRPQIVRADTLDLQDQHSPSAQDHSNPHATGSPLGTGPAAPHQEKSLRHASDELSTEEKRLSQQWLENGILDEKLDDEDERAAAREGNKRVDELAISQNGGLSGDEEEGDLDQEDDGDLDDDMMDKVSSSPSIEDGSYIHSIMSKPLPPLPKWPRRSTSLLQPHKPLPSLPNSPPTPPPEQLLCVVSPPFHHKPNYFPLRVRPPRLDQKVHKVAARVASIHSNSPKSSLSLSPFIVSARDHHYLGEYDLATSDPFSDNSSEYADEARDVLMPLPSEMIWYDDSIAPSEEFYDVIEPEQSTPRTRYYEDDHQDELTPTLSSPDEDPFVDSTPGQSPRPLISSPWSSPGFNSPSPYNRPPSPPDSISSWETTSDTETKDLRTRYDDLEAFSFLQDNNNDIGCACGDDCLQNAEDIDFEFVYALHTFVATVEGQANAQKGDTMVLLDDSNSYWWLVRVVKDSSIGYLPAEHIETPTERLARLNKHRNLDLAATMLGDTAEKSKNPLKKAMRRRNAKTVHFTDPTYVEPSDYEDSSDEDDSKIFGSAEIKDEQNAQIAAEQQDEITHVEPLKINGKKDSKPATSEPETAKKAEPEGQAEEQVDDETLNQQYNASKARDGKVRNTDSFFKDETTETRKITLTPKMLRDDSSSSAPSFESKDRSASFDSLEKEAVQEKTKDEKKKKEKKPGMLSGLFKRKEKKGRGQDSLDGEIPGEDARGSPQPKTSEDASPLERSDNSISLNTPQRQTSKGKLQKPPPNDHSPLRSKPTNEPATTEKPTQSTPASATLRPVQTDVAVVSPEKSPESQARSPEQEAREAAHIEQQRELERSRSNSRSALGILRSGTDSQPIQQAQPERAKVKKAKKRMELDDFDSDNESPATGTSTTNPWNEPTSGRSSKQKSRTTPVAEERLSESPVQITAADATEPTTTREQASEPVADTSSQATPQASAQATGRVSPPSPVSPDLPGSMPGAIPSSPPISPSTFPAAPVGPPSHAPPAPPGANHSANPSELDLNASSTRTTPTPPQPQTNSSHSSPQSSSEPWSPTSLRNYLDDGSEIRDFLMVVRDVRGVTPVGKDHPILNGLFLKEQGRCDELSRMLDGLLGEVVSRKKANGTKSGAAKAGSRPVKR